jgi:DNA replication protein DnaC
MDSLDFKLPIYGVEGIKDMENDIFPSHFFIIIIGSPGSGKTTFIKFALKSKQLLHKKFDLILCMSNSPSEFSSLMIPNSNFCETLNEEWLKSKIAIINKKYNNEYINLLIIIDDLVVDSNDNLSFLMKLVYNRRHLLNNGMISIFMTSQKLKVIPAKIRVAVNGVTVFNCLPGEAESICYSFLYSNALNFKKLCEMNLKDKVSY